MDNTIIGETASVARTESPELCRLICLSCATLLFLMTALPAISRAQTQQQQAKPTGSEPSPEPAVPAILAAFDKYEVVGMPEAHGFKDVDDFILSLIRNPAFPKKVNDIAVECGNSLYQPVLDRYIAGDDVPFTEVRKVWRNTTQAMCGTSGFFEQFFPLVRAINRKLPPAERLRVLAGDPPIEWDQIRSFQDRSKFTDRDASIASVMEKEVLAKHRKALMLFGTFHLFHGQTEGGLSRNAVSIYEKDYPNVTFAIADLLMFNANSLTVSGSPFASWPLPSIARAKGTWLGALDLGHFSPPPTMIDQDCNTQNGFPKGLQKPMAELVDAFLYLGPPDLGLWEKMPADIVLDADHRKELRRREVLSGFPGEQESDQDIVNEAENPVFFVPTPPDTKLMVQDCIKRKSRSSKPQ
jgi:hypothetical protein